MKSKRYPLLPTAAVLTFAAALVCLSGCAPTLECGSWAFSGIPRSNPDVFPLSSAFTFTPATCGKSCACTKDVMTQMVWVYNSASGSYMYPSSSQQARATANGWSIDQLDGWAYGYYGLDNDGVTFDPAFNPPGSNGTPNTLYDAPGNWPNDTWFAAVDAATCFQSATCNNRILGYYYWSWIIDSNGNAAKFIIAPAWKDLDSVFQSAVAGWNAWAPTSGTENMGPSYPGQPVLPNAVNFPTLSDL